jgi:putative MATE family efflux protein
MKFIKSNKALIFTIITISLPAIIEMALNTLVGIADTVMISRFIGKEALSGAGNANQLMQTIIFIFSSFNIGATAMISRNYGERNFVSLNKTVGQNFSLNLIIGFVISILSVLFSSQIMQIFDVTTEVYEMGVSYFYIVSFSQVFMFISFAAAASLRGIGNTVTPMLITGLVNILNVIGNYLLINGIGVFPEMGVEGAALSTTISRAVGSIIYIIIMIKGNVFGKFTIKSLRINKEVLKPLWKLSSMAGLEQFLMQTSFLLMGIIITILDTDSEAAFRIILSIESISFMPAIGFSIAASTLVGKALGEKDRTKAFHTGYICMSMGVLWGVVSALLFLLFPSYIVGIFSDNTEILNMLIHALRFVAVTQPFLSIAIIVSGALRGAGDVRAVMVMTSLRLWVIFVPVTYILVKFAGVGIESVWITESTSLVVFNLVMLKRFHDRKWTEIEI